MVTGPVRVGSRCRGHGQGGGGESAAGDHPERYSITHTQVRDSVGADDTTGLLLSCSAVWSNFQTEQAGLKAADPGVIVPLAITGTTGNPMNDLARPVSEANVLGQ